MSTDPALAQALLGHHLKHALKACEAVRARAAAQRALYRDETLTLALQLIQTQLPHAAVAEGRLDHCASVTGSHQ